MIFAPVQYALNSLSFHDRNSSLTSLVMSWSRSCSMHRSWKCLSLSSCCKSRPFSCNCSSLLISVGFRFRMETRLKPRCMRWVAINVSISSTGELLICTVSTKIASPSCSRLPSLFRLSLFVVEFWPNRHRAGSVVALPLLSNPTYLLSLLSQLVWLAKTKVCLNQC